MKKMLTFTLALLILLSTAACGNGNNAGSSSTSSSGSTAESQTSADASDSGSSQSSAPAAQAKLSGKLELIQLDDRDASVLRGMRITGNRVGSEEDINGKPSSLTDVRCVFEMNEWVEFYPDADASHKLRVWALRHRDDQEYYNSCTFSEEMPGFGASCDLSYPEDAEEPENTLWGNFYLHPEECEAGYYDLVFTEDGKAIATLLTRFYSEGELSNRSGAELEKLNAEP